MLLTTYLNTVYLPSRIAVSDRYKQAMHTLVRQFSDYLGRPAVLTDLTECTLAAFLGSLASSHAATSANSFRARMLAVWRSAYDDGLLDSLPRTKLIRRLPEEHDPPEAWTVEEVGQLVFTASQTSDMVGDITASDFWVSLLLTTYWTGCRIGALMKTTTDNYRAGSLLVRNQKNHRSQLYSLPESCCEMIDATDPSSRNMLWPWPYGRRWLWTTMRRIVERSGIPCPRTGRQLFHRIRRTTLSYCAIVDPAIAQRQAGHASYQTTLSSYIAPKIIHAKTAADVLPEPMKRPTLKFYG